MSWLLFYQQMTLIWSSDMSWLLFYQQMTFIWSSDMSWLLFYQQMTLIWSSDMSWLLFLQANNPYLELWYVMTIVLRANDPYLELWYVSHDYCFYEQTTLIWSSDMWWLFHFIIFTVNHPHFETLCSTAVLNKTLRDYSVSSVFSTSVEAYSLQHMFAQIAQMNKHHGTVNTHISKSKINS